MKASKGISKVDRSVLDALARAGLDYVRLPNDAKLVREAIPTHEVPARRLAAMASRGSLFRVSRGVYVVARPGARSIRQAADKHVLLSATFEGRVSYYLGFLNALAEHGLTDETATGLRVATGDHVRPPRDLAGWDLVMTKIPPDAPSDELTWTGVERIRIRGRMFYRRASAERTLIDALDRPALCGPPEVWVRAWGRAVRNGIELPSLLDLAQSRSKAVAARCALLLRELGHAREGRLLTSAPVTGRVLFDAADVASRGGSSRRDRETGLIMNVPMETLRGWLEYGK